MLSKVTRTTTSGITAIALALALTTAAPVRAGEAEDNFLKGVAATLLVGTIVHNINKQRVQQRQIVTAPQPRYFVPQAQQPYYAPPAQQVRYSPAPQPALYSTPAARAFNSYTPLERRNIQMRLADYGYYLGGIDGAFGPSTHAAIADFARDSNKMQSLTTLSGAFDIYQSLLG